MSAEIVEVTESVFKVMISVVAIDDERSANVGAVVRAAVVVEVSAAAFVRFAVVVSVEYIVVESAVAAAAEVSEDVSIFILSVVMLLMVLEVVFFVAESASVVVDSDVVNSDVTLFVVVSVVSLVRLIDASDVTLVVIVLFNVSACELPIVVSVVSMEFVELFCNE